MAWIIGVDRTEIRSRPNANRSRIDRGVAGRSIVAEVGRRLEAQWIGERTGGPGQRRQDAARKVDASESRVGARFYCNRSVL